MSTSTKKFGASLTNILNDLSVDNQRIYQLKKRNKHTAIVKSTGINYAEPLKKKKKSTWMYLSTIR